MTNPREPFHPRARLYAEVHELDGSKRAGGLLIVLATMLCTLSAVGVLVFFTVR